MTLFASAARKVLLEQYNSGLAEDELPNPEYDYEDVGVWSDSYSEWPNLAGRLKNYTTATPHTSASPHANQGKSSILFYEVHTKVDAIAKYFTVTA
ncbi:hypothetical protein J6590_108164, partial [Homalodisca vitripennis]